MVHRDYSGGENMISVCHVIFQDHGMKVSCDFMGRYPKNTAHHIDHQDPGHAC